MAVAAGLEGGAAVAAARSRAAYDELRRHGRPTTAASLMTVAGAVARWGATTATTLRWRARAIDAGQRSVVPPGGGSLIEFVARRERARFAATEPTEARSVPDAFERWFRNSYGDGCVTDSSENLAVIVFLMSEYARLGDAIDAAEGAGLPDSSIGELERERNGVLRLVRTLTGSEVRPQRVEISDAPEDAGLVRIGWDHIATTALDGHSRSRRAGSRPDGDIADATVVAQEWEFDSGNAVAGWTFTAIPGTAGVNVIGYETGAGVQVGLGDDGLEVDVEGAASVYLVEVDYEASYGPLDAGFEAQIGAEVSGEASLQVNPLDGDVELEAAVAAFAGASVEAVAALDTRYGGAGGGIRGHAGIGGAAHVDIGFEDGVFALDAGADAAIGLGLGFGVDVQLDLAAVVTDAVNIADWAADAAGVDDAVELATNSAGGLVDGFVDAASTVFNPGRWFP